MMLDIGSQGVPSGPEEETTDPDATRIQSHHELAPLQDIRGRVVGIVAVPVHLPPEKPLSLELPLTLKPEELQVRLEEFLTAAAYWNITEILQALSEHSDHLRFRTLALNLSKSTINRDIRATSNSINRKLESAREAIHLAIAMYGANRLKKATETFEQADSKLALLPAWRRALAFSTRRVKHNAEKIIPEEILRYKIAIEFLGGAIQIKFQPGSIGADETEEMKILNAALDEIVCEENDIDEKIKAVECVQKDLAGMKFPKPN